jgi:elongation factor Tu
VKSLGPDDPAGQTEEREGSLGGVDMITPGDHAEVALELQKPVGMEPGMRFAVREGGKTVGAGVILSVE